MAIAQHRHLTICRLSGSPAPLRVARSPVVFLVATPRWPPVRCAARLFFLWSSETRRHQEDKPLTGAVENMRRLGLIRPWDPSWCPVTLSRRAARCWPSAGLRGGQLAVSSHVLWIVCGRLPLRGHRGPGPVRASVHLSRVLVETGVTLAVHLHGPAPLATPPHNP